MYFAKRRVVDVSELFCLGGKGGTICGCCVVEIVEVEVLGCCSFVFEVVPVVVVVEVVVAVVVIVADVAIVVVDVVAVVAVSVVVAVGGRGGGVSCTILCSVTHVVVVVIVWTRNL